MDKSQWDNVDQHILKTDGATLAGYVIGGAILALGIWQSLQPVKKYPEEIRRPGDPVAWPWSKQQQAA